ncbi:uncharacterized protein B0H18DRAFT_977247, partial [Fomitopsis serialis]|uniref:uncharacterized protein n=1 Tax=Fomitopsis serialis TaxID=139415 RepID=UPI00200764AD
MHVENLQYDLLIAGPARGTVTKEMSRNREGPASTEGRVDGLQASVASGGGCTAQTRSSRGRYRSSALHT